MLFGNLQRVRVVLSANREHLQAKSICSILRVVRFRFDDATFDAISILGSLPQNVKAFFRAATAYY
jgi:hypothetical protein